MPVIYCADEASNRYSLHPVVNQMVSCLSLDKNITPRLRTSPFVKEMIADDSVLSPVLPCQVASLDGWTELRLHRSLKLRLLRQKNPIWLYRPSLPFQRRRAIETEPPLPETFPPQTHPGETIFHSDSGVLLHNLVQPLCCFVAVVTLTFPASLLPFLPREWVCSMGCFPPWLQAQNQKL